MPAGCGMQVLVFARGLRGDLACDGCFCPIADALNDGLVRARAGATKVDRVVLVVQRFVLGDCAQWVKTRLRSFSLIVPSCAGTTSGTNGGG